MKWFAVFSVMVLSFTAGSVFSAEDPRKTAKEAVGTFVLGCEQELATWCKDVTPGEGRLIACLYAHEDKVSSNCLYAIYDSATQLERALGALSYLVNECREDLESHCAEIKPGEGRILGCLQKNEEKVSSRCKTALKDAKMKE